jgi:hypothetical protein
MWGRNNYSLPLLSVSLTALVFHYNSVVVFYLPAAQKDNGGNEKVCEIEIMRMRALDSLVLN